MHGSRKSCENGWVAKEERLERSVTACEPNPYEPPENPRWEGCWEACFVRFSGRGACWELGRGAIKHSLDNHGLGEPGWSGAGGQGLPKIRIPLWGL